MYLQPPRLIRRVLNRRRMSICSSTGPNSECRTCLGCAERNVARRYRSTLISMGSGRAYRCHGAPPGFGDTLLTGPLNQQASSWLLYHQVSTSPSRSPASRCPTSYGTEEFPNRHLPGRQSSCFERHVRRFGRQALAVHARQDIPWPARTALFAICVPMRIQTAKS